MRLISFSSFQTSLRILLSGCVLLLCSSFSLNNPTWVSEYNKEGIEIFTRNTTGNSLKEFKAVTRMKTTLQTLMAVMSDHMAHPKWMDGISTCKMIREIGPQEKIFYYTIPFPWPMSDRDLVLRSSFRQNPTTRAIEIRIKSEPNEVPLNESVRMKIAEGSWSFLPLSDGTIEISYQFYSDPTGIPAWIVNMFILNTPVNTMNRLKEMIQMPAYQGKTFEWLH